MEQVFERKVRSTKGLIPWHEPEDHGFSVREMLEWCKAEEAADRAHSMDEFNAAHGLCNDCGIYGARMIGWSKPTNEIESKPAEEFGIEQLPLYETCPTCSGTGKADRSKWSGLSW